MTSPSLRVGSLFGRPVLDADGRDVGRVHDLRVRRDGPIIPGFGPALRIEGIIIGTGSIASRLGLDRPDITAPWPLHLWAKRAARTARFVPWEHIEVHNHHITCSERHDEMRSAHQ